MILLLLAALVILGAVCAWWAFGRLTPEQRLGQDLARIRGER